MRQLLPSEVRLLFDQQCGQSFVVIRGAQTGIFSVFRRCLFVCLLFSNTENPTTSMALIFRKRLYCESQLTSFWYTFVVELLQILFVHFKQGTVYGVEQRVIYRCDVIRSSGVYVIKTGRNR